MRKLLMTTVGLLTLASAMAATINGSEPKEILDLAKGHGSAELSTDKQGDPLIQGRIKGYKYQILFYDCKSGNNCETVTFDAAWENSGDVDLKKINEWNQNKRFGRAFLDSDGDPALDWDVNLTHGVNSKNFDDTLQIWGNAMEQFAEFIK